ncbi:MAG: hypothetical protein Q9162_000106 [Coniocarpon cinnabarinum]
MAITAPTQNSSKPTKPSTSKRKNPTSRTNHTTSTPSTSTASIPWTSLDVSTLARYRHAYALDVPLCYGSLSNRAVLSKSIGNSSPTMLKSRKLYGSPAVEGGGAAGSSSVNATTGPNGTAGAGGTEAVKGAGVPGTGGSNGANGTGSTSANGKIAKGKKRDGKVTKKELAMACRRHFNGQAVNDMDVLSEVAYKVQEGREFRAPPRRR